MQDIKIYPHSILSQSPRHALEDAKQPAKSIKDHGMLGPPKTILMGYQIY